MNTRNDQFGLFSLLVLTTAASLCFAVIRLHLNIETSIVVVEAIVWCYLYWASSGGRNVNPNLIRMFVFASLVPFAIVSMSERLVTRKNHPSLVFDIVGCTLTLLSVVPLFWFAFRAFRGVRAVR
jgi:hypothetical protein